MSETVTATSNSPVIATKLLRLLGKYDTDREISNAAIGVYAMRLCGVGVAFLLQVMVAKHIGAEGYGIFAFAWVLATIVGQFCCCGFNETANRFLPAYIVADDLQRARGFVQFSGLFVFTVAAIICLAGIAGMILLRDYIPEPYFLPTLLAMTCAPLLCVTHLKEAFSISRSLPLHGLMPTYVIRPLALMAVIWVAITFGFAEAGADTALGALLISALLALMLQALLLRKPMRRQLGHGEAVIEVRKWLGASLPLLFAQGFFLLATSIDVFLLSGLVASDQVGVYFAGAKIVACVSFIQMAVGAAIARRLSEAVQQQDQEKFDHHFERGRHMMMWPTLVGVVLVILASPIILQVFGSEFTSGTPIVALLASGILLQSVAGPIQERMMVMNQQRAIAFIVAGSLAFNLAASIALTLAWGIAGAAIASTLSIVVRILLMHHYARRGPIDRAPSLA